MFYLRMMDLIEVSKVSDAYTLLVAINSLSARRDIGIVGELVRWISPVTVSRWEGWDRT